MSKASVKQKAIYQGLTSLSGKTISQEYKFNRYGSQVFELLRQSPFYPMGKAGEQIAHNSADAIAKLLGPCCHLVDMGCGMGKISKIYAEKLHSGSIVSPVDISKTAVNHCVRMFKKMPNIRIGCYTPKDFFDGLRDAVTNRKPGEKICAALLGGTIANFSRTKALGFLYKVRKMLSSGDYFLLATDMDKPKKIIEDAYNDPLFLAASWNLNTLAHLNTVFYPESMGKKTSMSKPFNLRDFEHKATYFDNNDAPNNQHIEMYVVAKKDLKIKIPNLGIINIRKNEKIKTYESHRFTNSQIRTIARKTGYIIVRRDESSPKWRFCHTLLRIPGCFGECN